MTIFPWTGISRVTISCCPRHETSQSTHISSSRTLVVALQTDPMGSTFPFQVLKLTVEGTRLSWRKSKVFFPFCALTELFARNWAFCLFCSPFAAQKFPEPNPEVGRKFRMRSPTFGALGPLRTKYLESGTPLSVSLLRGRNIPWTRESMTRRNCQSLEPCHRWLMTWFTIYLKSNRRSDFQRKWRPRFVTFTSGPLPDGSFWTLSGFLTRKYGTMTIKTTNRRHASATLNLLIDILIDFTDYAVAVDSDYKTPLSNAEGRPQIGVYPDSNFPEETQIHHC